MVGSKFRCNKALFSTFLKLSCVTLVWSLKTKKFSSSFLHIPHSVLYSCNNLKGQSCSFSASCILSPTRFYSVELILIIWGSSLVQCVLEVCKMNINLFLFFPILASFALTECGPGISSPILKSPKYAVTIIVLYKSDKKGWLPKSVCSTVLTSNFNKPFQIGSLIHTRSFFKWQALVMEFNKNLFSFKVIPSSLRTAFIPEI